MRRGAWFALLVSLAMVAVAADTDKRFGKESQWHPRPIEEEKVWADMRQCGAMMAGGSPGTFEVCVGDAMRKHGASDSAIAFNKAAGGNAYATRFIAVGKVDLMQAMNPFMANSNQQMFFVNGEPAVVSADEVASKLDAKSNAAFQALARKYPDAFLFPHVELDSLDTKARADGGIAFFFDAPLLNGCHACAQVGRAVLEYDFDVAGKFRGARIAQVVGES